MRRFSQLVGIWRSRTKAIWHARSTELCACREDDEKLGNFGAV
ncbi:unnamed protein product [Protopolystoma xenopodis]|uniref:Uncharacterized protein n=1 Tax=Protopolystoma xenopodis TaxID=117903 RepID=A0A448WZL2_9PLAT|nr:unnamed protein product [Protopolystoma xenopodis]